jgi:hypothetical protein
VYVGGVVSGPIFKVGDVTKTRGGWTARILAVDLENEYPMAVVHKNIPGGPKGEFVHMHKQNGACWCEHEPNDHDLLPPEQVGYVNVYEDGLCESRVAADNDARSCRIACVRITYRPGQMDD